MVLPKHMKFFYFLYQALSAVSAFFHICSLESLKLPTSPFYSYSLFKSWVHLFFENSPNFPGWLIAYCFGIQQNLIHTFSTTLFTLFFICVSSTSLWVIQGEELIMFLMCLIYFELFPVCPASSYTTLCMCRESPGNHIALESFYGIWCYQVWCILNYLEHKPFLTWVPSRKAWFLRT